MYYLFFFSKSLYFSLVHSLSKSKTNFNQKSKKKKKRSYKCFHFGFDGCRYLNSNLILIKPINTHTNLLVNVLVSWRFTIHKIYHSKLYSLRCLDCFKQHSHSSTLAQHIGCCFFLLIKRKNLNTPQPRSSNRARKISLY